MGTEVKDGVHEAVPPVASSPTEAPTAEKENGAGGFVYKVENEKGGKEEIIEADYDLLSMSAQEILRFKQNTRQRKWLAIWVAVVVSIWLGAVLLVTAFNEPWCLRIDEQVLITLLATTTLNVLVLSKIVLGGLFGGKDK